MATKATPVVTAPAAKPAAAPTGPHAKDPYKADVLKRFLKLEARVAALEKKGQGSALPNIGDPHNPPRR
jgi:hypothetical protein